MLIFGSFTKKTIKSYNFICNSHKKVNKKEFIRTGRNKKGRVHIGVSTPTGTLPCQNGGDLLSRLRSTIGVAELNCPVRNGKGWNLRAKATSISLRP